MPVLKPESEYVEQYGELPDKDGVERIRAGWTERGLDLEAEWVDYWLNSDRNVELLERFYMFWMLARQRIED